MTMSYKSREDSLREFHVAFGHPIDEPISPYIFKYIPL